MATVGLSLCPTGEVSQKFPKQLKTCQILTLANETERKSPIILREDDKPHRK